MTLSKNFELSEFTRSATAQRLGIANEPGDTVIVNLFCLAYHVLQPLREHHGRPITISSGYRSATLNKAVGGVANSQHLRGEAADIAIPLRPDGRYDMDVANDWFGYIQSHLTFDQLILERANGKVWIHVSCRRDPSQNRRSVIIQS